MAWLRKAEAHQRTGDDANALAAWQAVLQLAAHLDPLPDARLTASSHGADSTW